MSILAELPHLEKFSSARNLAAYIGLTPKHYQSGTSVKGRSKISKMGNSLLRKALFLPAMAAAICSEYFGSIKKKMTKVGKKPKVIICAIMQRLVHIIYGIIKHGEPFRLEKLKSPAS